MVTEQTGQMTRHGGGRKNWRNGQKEKGTYWADRQIWGQGKLDSWLVMGPGKLDCQLDMGTV